MVARYPTAIKSFTPRVDLSDTVMADDVNTLQEEVNAIETTLGAAITGSAFVTGVCNISNESFTNVDARLQNIELGLFNGVDGAPYVRTTGNSVIQSTSVVGLAQKTMGGTSNLYEAYSEANSLGFKIDYLGIPYVNTSPVLYVGSSAYNALLASIANATAIANSAAAARTLHPFLLAGM